MFMLPLANDAETVRGTGLVIVTLTDVLVESRTPGTIWATVSPLVSVLLAASQTGLAEPVAPFNCATLAACVAAPAAFPAAVLD